jgi:hypothetical protein
VLRAAVVCPHPPLLVPEVAAGAAGELDELRAACDDAVAAGLATAPEVVVVVGAADRTGPAPPGAAASWAPYGMPGPGPTNVLPLSLATGAWLLDRAGWAGPRLFHGVAADETAPACAALGAGLTAGRRTLLLVLGDGSARRSAAAPGHLDPRAEGFDDAVAAALGSGDAGVLLALDADLAFDLLAAGRPAWQVLAGAAAGSVPLARLLYAGAPYGVGYLVATWLPAPDTPTAG